MTRPWPNLLYVGDVPVEHSYHGSALLYRLLERVPASQLVIVESNLFRSREDRRLPGVRYRAVRVGTARLLNSRLHRVYARWLMRRASGRVNDVLRSLDGFRPDAVVTVAHGYSWLTAAHVARRLQLPLHLIVHDDWPRIAAAILEADIDDVFGAIYRGAASRLCVSPAMMEQYQARYGAGGTVLLPARSHGAPVFDGPPEHLRRPISRPVFAFAGTINSPGYARLLRQLADTLSGRDGQLHIFGPLSPREAEASGLATPAIVLRGLLAPDALLDELRRSAHVVVIPMSFAASDRANMELSFPSKLADYTAAALPMLICGPPYCSAVRWANANPGVAVVATSEDDGAMDAAVNRLLNGGPEFLHALALTAQRIGDRDFSADAAERVFHEAATGR
jgi:hypothetical protein